MEPNAKELASVPVTVENKSTCSIYIYIREL